MNGFKELLYDWMGGNEVIFLAINHLRGADYDRLMRTISWLGDHERFPLYLLIIAVYVLFALCKKTIFSERGKWFYTTGWIGVFAVLLSGYAVTGAVTYGLKEAASMPRPYVALAGKETVYKLEATEREDDYRSFPSGHVMFTAFMLTALAPMLSSFLQACGLTFLLLVAWSRVSLGMHFPSDVLAAILIMPPLISILRFYVYKLLRMLFGIKC